MTRVYEVRGAARALEAAGAWLLGALWVLPLVYAIWTAFHAGEYSPFWSLGMRLGIPFILGWDVFG